MFQLVQTCTEWPHNDPLGLQSPKGYVDTGIDVPHADGRLHRLYLSETIVREGSRHFGYCSPDEAKTLRDIKAEVVQQAYADGFQAAIDKLREMSETLVTA